MVIESKIQLQQHADEGQLGGVALRGFAAPGIGLVDADLDGVTLDRLDLQNADCTGARLEAANMTSVDLRRGRFVRSLWNRVRAQGCDFTGVDMSDAEILRCRIGPLQMSRGQFCGAKLQATQFCDTELHSADFSNAVLIRTSFEGYTSTASLSRVQFRAAALVQVVLAGVNLYEATFRDALLVGCDLRGASLCGADLRGARLVDCMTDGVDLDGATLN